MQPASLRVHSTFGINKPGFNEIMRQRRAKFFSLNLQPVDQDCRSLAYTRGTEYTGCKYILGILLIYHRF